MLQPLHLVGDALAQRRQHMALRRAFEQFQPKVRFQPPQPPADRCGIQAGSRGDIRQPRVTADVKQQPEIVPVHEVLPAKMQSLAAILSIYRELYAR